MTHKAKQASIFAQLRDNRDGIAAVEFALIAPILIGFMLTMSDQLYQMYATSILEGAVQKAGRDATIEGNATQASTAALDARVLRSINGMAPTATAVSRRTYFPSFSDVTNSATNPESFQDNDNDGTRDTGECYLDTNGNGTYDTRPVRTGNGGADDIVLYTMTITYPRIFPQPFLLKDNRNVTIVATTLLKNQPWAAQQNANDETPDRICT